MNSKNNHELNMEKDMFEVGEKAEVTVEWVTTKIEIAKDDIRTEFNKQIQVDKASLVTVFGLFASVLSFLKIEFQFLKQIEDPKILVAFSLILFALLLGFNAGLDALVVNGGSELPTHAKGDGMGFWFHGLMLLYRSLI